LKSRAGGNRFPARVSGLGLAWSLAIRPYAAIVRHDSAQASQTATHSSIPPMRLQSFGALGADFRTFAAGMLVVGGLDHEMG